MAYRRRKGHDTWHFCSNRSEWPTTNYDEQQGKPTTGELCNECKSKRGQVFPILRAPLAGELPGTGTGVESFAVTTNRPSRSQA
jgi:hypothetical protein